jgi:DNA-binding transcriptional ArsR family regulator
MTRTRRSGLDPALVIEVLPAAEFLLSISSATNPHDVEALEIGSDWMTRVQERAGDELLERIGELSGGETDFFVNLVPLAYDAPRPQSVRSFLAHLGDTDATEIRLHVVDYYSREIQRMTPPDVIRRAVAGDREAIAEFVRTSYPDWEPRQAFLRHQLTGDPEAMKRELIEVLETWAERVWTAEEPKILPILERDVEEKRALSRRLPFDKFIETATNGVEWVPRPHVSTVVMIPSYVNRPWVSMPEYGDTFFHIFPVSDESVSAETDTPPLRLVRLSKALGDEKRLRILRALSEGDRTLMELAEQFGLAKTTMHHHMVTLRAAGLVTVGAGKRYRLRHETLPDLGELLGGYLGRNLGAAPPADQPSPEGAPADASAARPPRRRTRGTEPARRPRRETAVGRGG